MTPSGTLGTGPAGPQLTPSEWAHVEALCIVNANAANAPIRAKIQAYFTSRDHLRTVPGAFRDPQIAPSPPRGHQTLDLPTGTSGLWHPHPFRGQTNTPSTCGVCGRPANTPWHT